MRFLVIVPADKDSEAGVVPDQKIFAEMTKFNEELAQAGVMLGGEGLQPTSKGVRIQFEGGRQTVLNGPFNEPGRKIAGYWVIQAKDKDEAIKWMKKAPFDKGVEIEIRQIAEAEEFGDALTPELRQREEHIARRARENARQPA
jgi:hypothetical protein